MRFYSFALIPIIIQIFHQHIKSFNTAMGGGASKDKNGDDNAKSSV